MARDNCVNNGINKPDSQLVETRKKTQQILPVNIIYNLLIERHRRYFRVASIESLLGLMRIKNV